MNIVKCANGHFFDSETYKLCPHCGAPIGTSPSAPAAPVQPQKKEKKGISLFGKKKDKQTHSQEWPASQPQGGYNSYNQGYGTGNGYYSGANESYMEPGAGYTYNQPQVRTEDVPVQFPQNNAANAQNGKTLDFWQTVSGGNVNQAAPEVSDPVPMQNQPAAEHAPQAPVQPVSETPAPENVEMPAPQPAAAPEQPAPAPAAPAQNSLLSEVRQASASDEGKTLSYFSAVTGAAAASAAAPSAAAPSGSPAAPSAPKAIDPVVGWLVSLEGPHFGESFPVYSGMNSIGRNSSNRIVLDRDMAVSREKHAFITYEPKHRRFYVKPGDSSGLIYVNEEYITENHLIAPRDVLELGSSKLCFVPFCTEEFGWEDVLKK